MNYRLIETAFDIASMSDGLPHVIINRDTVQVLCDHEGLGEFEIKVARKEGVDVDGPDWVIVPTKENLGLGERKLALDFAADFLSDEDFCRARGIFIDSDDARFGSDEEQVNKNRAWQEYRHSWTEKIIRKWCAENEIVLEG